MAAATPAEARRAWPRWAALGLLLIAVAVVALLWHPGGGRLLLGALGLVTAGRGLVLAHGGAGRAGVIAAAVGGAALAVAVTSAAVTGWVLLGAVPVLLLGAGLALLLRGGASRRGGAALLVWTALVAGLLVVTGLAQGWSRAADVATVVTALATAVLGVPLLVGAANLRAAAARPEPARPAGCGGCACGAGGCGALG